MKSSCKLMTLAAIALAAAGPARAADLAGKWHAEFDTQIGLQQYTYEFRIEGDKITGKATFERETGSGEVDLKAIKLDGDKLSFVEPLQLEDREISITYSGTVAGDELKLTRQVGDIATEELVAKRVTGPPVKPAGAAK